MQCPRCESEQVEVIRQFPTIDYAEHGEYVCVYECKKCHLKFQREYTAEEDIFGE